MHTHSLMQQPHSAPPPTSPAGATDIIAAVSVQLAKDVGHVNKRALIDALFSGCESFGSETVSLNGDTFTAIRGKDRAKASLLSMFGCNRSLTDVDASIASLVAANAGWLSSVQDQQIELTNGQLSADLATICELVMSSLSANIVNQVKNLLENVHGILSGDAYWSKAQQIDVNLFQKNASDIVCVHSRYECLTSKRGVKVLFFGGSKRKITISFHLRHVGVASEYWDSLSKDEDDGKFILRNGLVERSPMPAFGRLRPTVSDPTQNDSPNLRRRRLEKELSESHADSPVLPPRRLV